MEFAVYLEMLIRVRVKKKLLYYRVIAKQFYFDWGVRISQH